MGYTGMADKDQLDLLFVDGKPKCLIQMSYTHCLM
jgi:hypothetical protein